MQLTSRVALALLPVLAQAGCVTGVPDPFPVAIGDRAVAVSIAPAETSGALTVMTVNLAHGRATGLHQALHSAGTARENLDDIASVIAREAPHVVAMQEADGSSIWSGRLCHPCRVARRARFAFGWHGLHAQGPGLSYGTALIARSPLTHQAKATFSGGLLTTPKGYTAAVMRWPGTALDVDVVSVHLDALRPSVRRAQMVELAAVFGHRRRPLILMGDFNTSWSTDLADLSDTLDLSAYEPLRDDLATYRRLGGRRLDWILVSDDIRFVDYRVLDDKVSDHRPVLATLALHRSAPGAGGANIAATAP